MSNYNLSDLEERIEKLQDKNKETRKKAVEELVKIFSQLTEPELQKKAGLALIASLVDSQRSVRDAAAMAIPYYVQDWAAEPLAGLLFQNVGIFSGSEHDDAILDALKKIGLPSVPHLAPKVWYGGSKENKKIREILISFGAKSVQPLIEVLQSYNPEASPQRGNLYPVYILAEIGEPAIEPLVQKLREVDIQSLLPLLGGFHIINIPEEKIRISEDLVRGIGAASSRGQEKYRDKIYHNDFTKREQRAFGSLTIPKPDAMEDVGILVKNMNPLMISLIAILKGSSTRYDDAIIKAYSLVGEQAIKSVMPDVDKYNVGAISFLGIIGGPLVVQPLLSLIEKENFSQSLVFSGPAIFEAMGRVGDSRFVSPLISYLDNENVSIRLAVIEALSKLSDSRAVEPLVRTLKDNKLSVRKAAIKALGQIGDNSAILGLTEQLSDTSGKILWMGARICDMASEALERIGTPEALDAVERWKTKKS